MPRRLTRLYIFVLVFGLLWAAAPVFGQESVQLTIYVSADRLVLSIPQTASGVVSLEGFEFQVQINGATRTFPLSMYPSFQLPFDLIPAPTCFSLLRSGANAPMPLACQTVAVFGQNLSQSDVVWYDFVNNQPRTIIITRNGVPVPGGICPAGQSECTFMFGETSTAPTPELPAFTMVDSAFDLLPIADGDQTVTFQYPEDWSMVTNTDSADFVVLMSTDPGTITDEQLAQLFYATELRDAILSGEQLVFLSNRGQGALNGITDEEAVTAYDAVGIDGDDFDNEPLARLAAFLWENDNAFFGEFRESDQTSTDTFDAVRLVGSYLPYDDEPTPQADTEIILSAYLLTGGDADDTVIITFSLNRIDQRAETLAVVDAIVSSVTLVAGSQG